MKMINLLSRKKKNSLKLLHDKNMLKNQQFQALTHPTKLAREVQIRCATWKLSSGQTEKKVLKKVDDQYFSKPKSYDLIFFRKKKSFSISSCRVLPENLRTTVFKMS